MASLTDVENAVAALLVSATGREIVQGRIGEGAVPAAPFVLWDLDRIDIQDFTRTELFEPEAIANPNVIVLSDGNPEAVSTEAQQIIISPNTPLEFVINMIGGSAMADMVRFALSLRQSQRTADLYKLCGLSGVGPMLDLSAVEIGTYRQRVEMRLTLFTALDLTAPAELLETTRIHVVEASKQFYEPYSYTKGECR